MKRDFDYWAKLYKRDPEQFEREHTEVLHKEIDRMTDDPQKRTRLKGMMWRLNVKYRRIKHPLARLAAVSHDLYKFILENR